MIQSAQYYGSIGATQENTQCRRDDNESVLQDIPAGASGAGI
jgi:hypothetical protein